MKYNTLNTVKGGKEVEVKGEVVLMLTSKEVDIVICALEDYVKENTLKKAAKELADVYYSHVPLV